MAAPVAHGVVCVVRDGCRITPGGVAMKRESCPVCLRVIAVRGRVFVQHRDKARNACPMSGRLFPADVYEETPNDAA